MDAGEVFVYMPLLITEKFYFVYIASYIGLACFSFRRYYRHRTKRRFWSFLFPRSIYTQQSAKVDYGVFVLNIISSPLIVVSAGMQTWVSAQVGGSLLGVNNGAAIVAGEWSVFAYAVFILGYTLAADFSLFI